MTKQVLSITLILIILLSACSPVSTPPATLAPSLTPPTPVPPTEIPVPATKVWVSLGGGLSQEQLVSLGQSLQGLIQQSGWEMEQKPAISMADLDASAAQLKAVVILPPDPGAAEMAQKYPAISFLTVGIPGLPELPNLFRAAPDGNKPEWDGFLAGYIAAILAPEWRIGVLTQSGSQEGANAADGFINGGVLYCGLCLTQYPPFTDYPYRMDMNAGSSPADWQSSADQFIASGVRMAYVFPTLATPEVLVYLAQNGLALLGSVPPPNELQSIWIATIQTDLLGAMQKAWIDLTAGNPPGEYGTRPQIIPGGSGLLTEGKLALLNSVIDDLVDGVIEPLMVQ